MPVQRTPRSGFFCKYICETCLLASDLRIVSVALHCVTTSPSRGSGLAPAAAIPAWAAEEGWGGGGGARQHGPRMACPSEAAASSNSTVLS